MRFDSAFWKTKDHCLLINDRLAAKQKDLFSALASVAKLDDPHVFIPTSGSTQMPKLVCLSRKAILASAESVNKHLEVSSKDVFLVSIPSFHVGGLGIYARAYVAGATAIESTYGLGAAKWNPEQLLREIQEYQVNILSLVPTQLYDLVELGVRCPGSVRALVLGGGALSPELYMKSRDLGYPVLPSYGMTEIASQIATAPLSSLSPGSTQVLGDPLQSPWPERLSHVDWEALSDGRFRLKSPSLLTGYLLWQEEKRIFQDPKIDGWLTPEDRVEIQGDQIRVLGRDSDFVRVGAETVILSDLNQSLAALVSSKGFSPQNFVIIEIPDLRKGAELVLVTDLKDFESQDFSDLRSGLAQIRAPFELPTNFRQIEQIPRTDLGKIQWSSLRNQLKR